MKSNVEKIMKKLNVITRDLDIVKHQTGDDIIKRLAVDIKLRVKDVMNDLIESEEKIEKK